MIFKKDQSKTFIIVQDDGLHFKCDGRICLHICTCWRAEWSDKEDVMYCVILTFPAFSSSCKLGRILWDCTPIVYIIKGGLCWTLNSEARGAVCINKIMLPFSQRANWSHFLTGRYLEGGWGALFDKAGCFGIVALGWQGVEVDERVVGGSTLFYGACVKRTWRWHNIKTDDSL